MIKGDFDLVKDGPVWTQSRELDILQAGVGHGHAGVEHLAVGLNIRVGCLRVLVSAAEACLWNGVEDGVVLARYAGH